MDSGTTDFTALSNLSFSLKSVERFLKACPHGKGLPEKRRLGVDAGMQNGLHLLSALIIMEMKMCSTEIVKINPEMIEEEKIRTIIRVLRREGIIVFPTETFYGIGANCYSVDTIRKIFRLKGRDFSKPLPVVISDLDMLNTLVDEFPPFFHTLSSHFWPGPLTLILNLSSNFPHQHLGSSTLGVRIPEPAWLRELIREASFPLTSTSANISGEREISSPEEAGRVFWGKVDLIVDGGETKGGYTSTVVDLTSKKPEILREGAIPASKVKAFLT